MSEPHDHAQTHDHVYLGAGHERAEARTRIVVYLTAAFMAVEIAAGLVFGSMALLADGVHMATHVGALGLSAWAYWMARRHAANRLFSFGSGKFGDLAGFSSALVLAIAALGVATESVVRIYSPVPIQYREAIAVAAVGLLVNIASAFLLQDEEDRAQGGHRDHNLRAAYMHVLADAATSVLALAALVSGAYFGLAVLDPVVGILGAIVIALWSIQLIRQTAYVLLDVEDDPRLAEEIRRTLEDDLNAQIADLHLWRLGPGHRALIVSLISPVPCSSEGIKQELKARHAGLSHVTIEIGVCEECAP